MGGSSGPVPVARGGRRRRGAGEGGQGLGGVAPGCWGGARGESGVGRGGRGGWGRGGRTGGGGRIPRGGGRTGRGGAPATPCGRNWPGGAPPNDKNPRAGPGREALGRSRGGLTTKIHLVSDRRCRPVTDILTPGQHGDCPQFIPLMNQVRIARKGTGRPRTRPARAMA